jgi:hypothetical protein
MQATWRVFGGWKSGGTLFGSPTRARGVSRGVPHGVSHGVPHGVPRGDDGVPHGVPHGASDDLLDGLWDGGERKRRAEIASATEPVEVLEGGGGRGKLRLRLITERCPLFHVRDERELPFPSPWWAFLWPGGRGLTRFLLEDARAAPLLHGKTVLEVGSGCGSAAIAAAALGARKVVANDICPYAGSALALNVELNERHVLAGVPRDTVSFLQGNRIGAGKDFFSQYDVVLVGDMLYVRQALFGRGDESSLTWGGRRRAASPSFLPVVQRCVACFRKANAAVAGWRAGTTRTSQSSCSVTSTLTPVFYLATPAGDSIRRRPCSPLLPSSTARTASARLPSLSSDRQPGAGRELR